MQTVEKNTKKRSMERNNAKMQKQLPKLKIQGRDNCHLLALLKTDWPIASSVIDKLGAFIAISARAKDSRNNVVQQILQQALQAYSRAVHHEQANKYADPVRIGVFLNAVLTETCRFLNVRLDDGKNERWTAQSGQSVGLWQSDKAAPFQMECDVGTPELRHALYELITCEQLKTVLRESNNEEAVLAGRMAFCH
ncbi:hypothetical protein [Eoetvoesiella caeni]